MLTARSTVEPADCGTYGLTQLALASLPCLKAAAKQSFLSVESGTYLNSASKVAVPGYVVASNSTLHRWSAASCSLKQKYDKTEAHYLKFSAFSMQVVPCTITSATAPSQTHACNDIKAVHQSV